MTSSVSVRDNGLVKRLRAIEGAAKMAVTAGVHADDGAEDHDGLTVAELATIHEFGAEGDGVKIPERSWLREYVDEQERALEGKLERAALAVVEGKLKPDQAMEQMGAHVVGQIKERILARISPALADVTVDRKGSDVPLVDTSQFIGAITYQVED